MSLALERAAWFTLDFERQARWYARHASELVAARYWAALKQTLELLARHPGLGRLRRFRHPNLRGLHSYRVEPPFHKHLIFYRHDETTLYAERVMHGARDLPRRLATPPKPKENDE
jgi:plasmid stabilization system protein ParE